MQTVYIRLTIESAAPTVDEGIDDDAFEDAATVTVDGLDGDGDGDGRLMMMTLAIRPCVCGDGQQLGVATVSFATNTPFADTA